MSVAVPLLLLQVTRADVRDMLRADALGLVLGVAHYEELEQPLDGGDRFLLYTDGLVEATNAAGEFFGLERVKSAIAVSPPRTPDGVADALLEALRVWSGLPAGDDLTIVLVDCAREAESAEA